MDSDHLCTEDGDCDPEKRKTAKSTQPVLYDEPYDDFVLEFHDKKGVSKKFCLILKEYDGKGIFLMRFRCQDPIVGLFEVSHYLRDKKLFYPTTIRDIVSQYVVNFKNQVVELY